MNDLDIWEARWAPYDGPTYHAALSFIQPTDVVLDIGAGDLRFAHRVAKIAQRVYAIEQQQALLTRLKPMPANLIPICGDARRLPWPTNITVGVLLMRHCTHVGLYAARLRASGCRRLITNARWGMDVELMDLGPRLAWSAKRVGWYACTCGHIGFQGESPAQVTEAHTWQVTEVETCPACAPKSSGHVSDK